MKRRAHVAPKLARITTQLVDRHTIEFGPGTHLDAPSARFWRDLQVAFLVDRFGSNALVVFADWERVRVWPVRADPHFGEVWSEMLDGRDVRVARHRRASRTFFEKLVDSAGYRADGACVIDGAIDDDFASPARQWLDSTQTAENNLVARRDAVYPVTSAMALRYTNVLRNVSDLQVDVDRVLARVGKGS